MILNTFDEYRAALKKCHLSESVMPLKRGYLVENVDLYNKIQKMLNCPDMEDCHPFLYGIDVDNINESDAEKIDKLYELGVERKFIEDDPEDTEGDEYAAKAVDGETDDMTNGNEVTNVQSTSSVDTSALQQADGYAAQAKSTNYAPTA